MNSNTGNIEQQIREVAHSAYILTPLRGLPKVMAETAMLNRSFCHQFGEMGVEMEMDVPENAIDDKLNCSYHREAMLEICGTAFVPKPQISKRAACKANTARLD